MATLSNASGKSATLSGEQQTTAGPGDGPTRSTDIHGTPDQRPESLGPPINTEWWKATASELMRRLPPFPGGGSEPLPAVVDTMANHLPRVVAPVELRPRADEETYLRGVLSLPGGSTEQIREAIVQMMVTTLTPAIMELGGAAASGGPSRSRPSPLPPPTSAPPSRGGPRMTRRPPVVQLCADVDTRFAAFREARIVTQGNIAGALGRGKTWEDVERAVPREDDKWQTWFMIADSIATSGGGRDVDDFYSCLPKGRPTGPGVGRESTFRMGNAVHAELQRRYLRAPEFRPNEVVAERFWYGPWQAGRPSRPKGKDLIKLRASERLDSVGALAWSMGSAETPYRLDIGDLTNLTVHEIKPVRSYGDGVLQLWQYVHNFNLSKYFDERSPGANDVGERLAAGGPIASILEPIDLEKVIPDPRPWERRWVANPWMLDAVPGVIAYTLVRKEKPDDGSTERLYLAIKIAVGAVLVVLAFAAVVAVIQAAAPELLALAQAAAKAAIEAAKAKLITSAGETTIGLAPIWEMAQSAEFPQAVRLLSAKAVGG